MSNKFKYVQINRRAGLPFTSLNLPASKSESNRALIIQALSGFKGKIKNISTARDTQTMVKLLHSDSHSLDVMDAGTTMRFLTAYLAATRQNRILTGTKRMCERPIGILVEALKELGAEIIYLKKEGYPPLHIKGFPAQTRNQISIRGDVSSQFISALLMIAPILKNGLTLTLTGKIGSKPYIKMTLDIMKNYGITYKWIDNSITIKHQNYKEVSYDVHPDWSGASYWYSMVSLAENAELLLSDFRKDSFQGDRIISEIMESLGVRSGFTSEGLLLNKKESSGAMDLDFTDHPDLAQTVAVVCAAKGIKAVFRGLESLKIKETDRISALRNELKKINVILEERNNGIWEITPGHNRDLPESISVNTYDDHRMAMAFSPLATLLDLKISDPQVVQKSYPSFWEDMKTAGFDLKFY